MGGAHSRVGAVVSRVVEAPVAFLAAGTREARFVGAEDAVVATNTLTVEDVGGPRAVRDAVGWAGMARAGGAVVVVATLAAGGRFVEEVFWSATRACVAFKGVAKK